jgi:hypothetical protein
MKWHVICLVTILSLYVNPIGFASAPAAANVPFSASFVVTIPASHQNVNYFFRWTHWQVVVWAYGACPGRVTLCRWRLRWRWGHLSSRKRHPTKRRRPVPPGSRPAESHPVSAEAGAQTTTEPEPSSEPPYTAGEDARFPLRLILRPGVILTKQGLQLRPVIARLGDDADEYRALWEDKEQFKATIQSLLRRSCPLCEGKSGFRCIGSDRRSVIPPGSKERLWFRIQKIECRACEKDTRILPTFCIPFKSHHAQTIQNVLENCWRRNNSYRDTTAILNQFRPEDGQYRGHTLPYEWTIWLGGLAIHLPQFLVWLGLQLPRHGLMDEYFLEQDNGTDNHRIFAVTVQDPESTAIWNIVRVDRNDTEAFKQTLQQLENVGVHLRAITTDGWPAILRAVREELSGAIHLLCYFHAKKNVFETLEKYRKAKKLPGDASDLAKWRRAFFEVLDAPTPKIYRAKLHKLTRQVAAEPILLARCRSLQKKVHYNTWRLRSPLLAATTSMVELTFKFLTRKMESMYSFRRSRCNAAQKSLIVWALVRDFVPYLPGAKYAGQSPAELAGVDLEGLPWLQYINLKLSEVA